MSSAFKLIVIDYFVFTMEGLYQNKILRNYVTYRLLNGHEFVLLV